MISSRAWLTGLGIVALCGPVRGELVVAEDGRPRSTITVAGDAPAPEAHAAAELARFLHEISGAALPIRGIAAAPGAAELAGGPFIFVGLQAAAQSGCGPTVEELERLGAEGYLVRCAPDRRRMVITGGRPRGTLYGVYAFLEEVLGCRWFTPDCSRIPRRATIALGPIDKLYTPPLEYRSTDYPNSRDGDWAARNRINGTQAALGEQHGGKIAYSHFVHTFNEILDPAVHFAAHPEYFSEIDGQRRGGQTQLCLTNPEVLQIAIATVRRWIAEAPDATIFSVSQNDWHNYCQCASCTALAENEGSQSGPLIHFVNAIGAAIEPEHPGVAISTLAYQYTRKPPRHARPRANVIVRLCSIECCFAHPLASDPFNKTFVDDIRAWSEICDRLYIWDYVIDYSHSIQPFPNLHVLKPNIRFFIEHGVKGMYEEANYFSAGGELAELRTWIIAKTLWDPDYDTERAIDEFLDGYYGAAAAPLREYIALVHERGSDPDEHVTIWAPPTHAMYRGDFVARASALFDAAETAVAGDPVLLARVQTARLPVWYLALARAAEPSLHTAAEGFEPDRDHVALLERFVAVARRAGVSRVRESGSGALDPWAEGLRGRLPAREGPLRALILTGDDYPGHPWRETSPILGRILEATGRFRVGIADDLEFAGTSGAADADVIVLNYCNWSQPAPSQAARENLAALVRGGKGLVLIHFTCGAFPDWPEFRRLAGRVWDRERTHDPYGRFTVRPVAPDHPVTRGMAEFETEDELYFCLEGEAEIEVLATARSKVTGQDEPMAFVLPYGEGRVFHTVLGHDPRALAAPGVGALLGRAAEWAATGGVR